MDILLKTVTWIANLWCSKLCAVLFWNTLHVFNFLTFHLAIAHKYRLQNITKKLGYRMHNLTNV